MYALDGTRRIPEHQLDWLAGYEGSAPVRVGNAAAGQLQLDVWGEVLDGLHQSRLAGIDADEDAWELHLALLDYLEKRWAEPDNGLWEARGPRRHFVHSKVMAWVGVDRAVQAVERFGMRGRLHRWKALREQIHAEVCERGFDRSRGTFTQFYGSKGLDAALLLIPAVGFLPGTTPAVVPTVDAVREELCQDGFVCATAPTPTAGSTDSEERRGRSSPARSGSSTRWWEPDATTRRGLSSSVCSSSETTWASSARSTTARPSASWATRRRHSATSAWSTQPVTSTTPGPPPQARRGLGPTGADQEKQAETAHDCDERCQSLAPPSRRVGRTGPRSPVRPSPPPQRPNLPFRPPMRS